MGNKLKIFLFTLVAMTFVGFGANYIIQERDTLKLKKIEIKSLSTELQELNLKYDNLNNKLEDANKDKKLNQNQIDALSEEKKRLEDEKIRLQAELQAKAEAKTKLAQASATVVNSATGTTTASAKSGSKEQWMTAAGIPQSDWQYVDYIVSKESGWNPCAYNPSQSNCNLRSEDIRNRACGLAQSLPCGKQEKFGHWADPVANLKWQHEYVTGRYGGYAQAYAFWTANKWY